MGYYYNATILIYSTYKVYGSTDGITFTKIVEAGQTTNLTSYANGHYKKTLADTFRTQYQYFGLVLNNMLSTSGAIDFSFFDLQTDFH